MRHNLNGNWTVNLPFGRGQHFASNANRIVNALIGDWQVVGTYRFHSGFQTGIGNGFNFPTNFFLTTPETVAPGLTTHIVTSGTN